MLIGCIKTPAVLKHQQLKDSRSDETKTRGSKRQRLNLHHNEEDEGLDELEGEDKGEDIGYVPFPFVTLPQNGSNRSTNMGERTRSLNHLVGIPKIS